MSFGSPRRIALIASVLACASSLPSVARAQVEGDSPAAAGSSIRGWFAGGLATVSHEPYGEDGSFITGSLRAAGKRALRPVFLLDVGANLKQSEIPLGGGATLTCMENCAQIFVSVALGVEYELASNLPFIHAAVGFTGEKIVLGDEEVQIDIDGAAGLTYVFGMGYDIPVGKFALTPFVQMFVTPKFDVKDTRGGASMNRLMIGVGYSPRH